MLFVQMFVMLEYRHLAIYLFNASIILRLALRRRQLYAQNVSI